MAFSPTARRLLGKQTTVLGTNCHLPVQQSDVLASSSDLPLVNSVRPKLEAGRILEWKGPSLSELLLPHNDTTPRRQYHEILLSSQGPARERPHPESPSVRSLELEEKLYDHPEARSGMAQVWRCKARRQGGEDNKGNHSRAGINVVLKLYVKSLANVSPDAIPLQPLKGTGPLKQWHRMHWTEGITAIDRYTMVSELMVHEQGRGIELDYGIYRFVVDGAECEGFVVEDSGKTTTSVAEWLQGKSREGNLNQKKLVKVLESAFALLQSFVDHGLAIRFSDLRFYRIDSHF
ncbi:hypothetical protein JCM3765_002298 [Sporobolomyces pararoseus]